MAFLQDALTTLGDTIGGSTVTHSTTTSTTTPAPPSPGKKLLLPLGIGAGVLLVFGLIMSMRQPRQIIVQPAATV